jgi:S-disulfanyl-L-cysteine oxidoreductase SoxD
MMTALRYIKAPAALLFIATTIGAHAAEPRTVRDGVYNAAQVNRGAALYATKCETCHGPKLEGGEAPPLTGAGFLANWSAYSVGDLFEKTRSTMPAIDPKSLSNQEYADLVALILNVNRFPLGDAELPATPERLKLIRFEAAK